MWCDTGGGSDVDDVWQWSISNLSERQQSQRVATIAQQVTDSCQQSVVMNFMYSPQADRQLRRQRVVHLVALQYQSNKQNTVRIMIWYATLSLHALENWRKLV